MQLQFNSRVVSKKRQNVTESGENTSEDHAECNYKLICTLVDQSESSNSALHMITDYIARSELDYRK